jgi:N6-L-threonylcarbamoyladenine synthase
VLRFVQKNPAPSENLKNEICYATQKAILDVLVKKTISAAEKYNVKTILVGGGVSANGALREQLEGKSLELGIKTVFPEKQYSTDNGAMIGAYALLNFKQLVWQDIDADPELYFA